MRHADGGPQKASTGIQDFRLKNDTALTMIGVTSSPGRRGR